MDATFVPWLWASVNRRSARQLFPLGRLTRRKVSISRGGLAPSCRPYRLSSRLPESRHGLGARVTVLRLPTRLYGLTAEALESGLPTIATSYHVRAFKREIRDSPLKFEAERFVARGNKFRHDMDRVFLSCASASSGLRCRSYRDGSAVPYQRLHQPSRCRRLYQASA